MNSVRGGNHGRLSMINQLPDEVLSHIISSLSIDEAVRSSVISKRWGPLWKRASRLDFDNRHMINPLFQNSLSRELRFLDPNNASQHAYIYAKIVDQVLHQHLGDLTTCRFKHFRRSLLVGEVEKWVEFVILNKGLTSLSLECELSIPEVDPVLVDLSIPNVKINFKPKIFSNLHSLELTNYVLNNAVSSAFQSCEKLTMLKLKKVFMRAETINGVLDNCLFLEKFSLIDSFGFKELKIMNTRIKYLELLRLVVDEIDVFIENLQVLVLNSLICPPKGLKIFTPKLKSFYYVYNAPTKKVQANNPEVRVLKTQDIFENCSHLLGSRTMNIFQNLFVLSIDLDLNNIREILSLSFVLRSCLYLKNLEITVPVNKVSNSNDDSDEGTLPFPNSMFWEREGISYNCINHKLKYATIRGFRGREQEVKFAKHLITNGNMMEKMTIICDSVTIVDEAKSLLSLPRASSSLSITMDLKFKTSIV
ncbi:unnamed protein product [Sphenostylis stenocarpa]|uniref:F-box domain-containing protein n=1 Tax=Sphenostylis stenocarpa TaxID=92480 RepID=A0AA86W4Q3_9FABA|nr:unnamed protein product [Sphenostylis stenocarpa]